MLVLPSYAKINLGLRILAKRPDGYHEIETLFVQIDLHDDVQLQQTRGGIEVVCDDPRVPLGEENLAYRAAGLILRQLNRKPGYRITLRKRIPVGAGLGGGSSNAAVTLLGINHLLGYPFEATALKEMALELGSDAPFFIEGGVAVGRGRGEILSKITLRRSFWIALVYPNLEISTRWAYQNFSLTKGEKNIRLSEPMGPELDPFTAGRFAVNELEGVVFARYPELAKLKEQLEARGAFLASLSGSGSSIFGVFEERAKAARSLRHLHREFSTFVCRPVRWGYNEERRGTGEEHPSAGGRHGDHRNHGQPTGRGQAQGLRQRDL